jgi:transposase-like protein
MEKPYQDTRLLDFQKKYQTEEDCTKRLFELRWPEGFKCPVCGHQGYYFVKNRKLYQCKGCRHQASLTAGTVMHGSRTPLLIWFWAIYLIATDKRGLSALALSKKLDLSYWKAWTMTQKIRRAMKDRDAPYQLAGIVEIDDSFFGGPKEGGDKRGRGSSKTTVIVEASTNGEGIGYAKMTVVDRIDGKTIEALLKGHIKENQTIKTDGFSVYSVVEKAGHKHKREVVRGKKAHEVMKWTHILISNAKAFILGTFHGIGKKHLQAYLDEFCYRFNRRNWELQLFDRLVTACVNSHGICYAELTK